MKKHVKSSDAHNFLLTGSKIISAAMLSPMYPIWGDGWAMEIDQTETRTTRLNKASESQHFTTHYNISQHQCTKQVINLSCSNKDWDVTSRAVSVAIVDDVKVVDRDLTISKRVFSKTSAKFFEGNETIAINVHGAYKLIGEGEGEDETEVFENLANFLRRQHPLVTFVPPGGRLSGIGDNRSEERKCNKDGKDCLSDQRGILYSEVKKSKEEHERMLSLWSKKEHSGNRRKETPWALLQRSQQCYLDNVTDTISWFQTLGRYPVRSYQLHHPAQE